MCQDNVTELVKRISSLGPDDAVLLNKDDDAWLKPKETTFMIDIFM